MLFRFYDIENSLNYKNILEWKLLNIDGWIDFRDIKLVTSIRWSDKEI